MSGSRLRLRFNLAGATLIACAVGGTVGCARHSSRDGYEVLRGTVEGARADLGQLVIRLDSPLGGRTGEARRSCLLPSNAEVYVNDKFVSAAAIEIGDEVELIGFTDPDPAAERFVVAFAYITHNEPPPPPIDLSPPATQPATQPVEN